MRHGLDRGLLAAPMSPLPGTVQARSAIRDHLQFAEEPAGSMPHLERVRDGELRAAHDAVQRSLSAIRTELAVLAADHVVCGHNPAALRLEKDFQALAMRMEDLLELASLRMDEGAVHLQPLMLDQAVRAAVEDVAASLRVHQVNLDLHLQADVAVTSDATRVREMALRFLDLGVRALEPGRRLQFRVQGRDGRASLAVEADGLAAAIEGSVGLRVCRTIAAALGGRLQASGDRLAFSLPMRSVHPRIPQGLADLRFL